GLALQRRQVVEHRGFLALLALLELDDRSRPALAGGNDRERLLLAGDARSAGRPIGAAGAVKAPCVGALGARRILVELAERGEGRVDEPIRLGLERPDLLLASRHYRERGRLHPPEPDRA